MTQAKVLDGRTRSRKPTVAEAIRQLIGETRARIPFDLPSAQVCSGSCQGCSMKLLEFLRSELEDWEQRLESGETPGLEDLSDLIRTATKVYRVLERNGLIDGQERR